MNTYHRQLAASIAGIHNGANLRELIQAAVESWQMPSLHDSSQPVKQPQPDSQPRQVQAILVLSRGPLLQEGTQTLLQQIIAQQRANGHSIAPYFTSQVGVIGDALGDIAYVYAQIRTRFSDLDGEDLMDRTREFSFRASDGNLGKYYVVFDRP